MWPTMEMDFIIRVWGALRAWGAYALAGKNPYSEGSMGPGRQPRLTLLPSCGTGGWLSKMWGLPGWAGNCSAWLKSHRAEGNEISLAAQLPQIFLLHIINYHPVLFSFYSLFQAVPGIYSLLWANCVRNGFLVFIFLCRHLKVLATDPAAGGLL